MGAEIDAGGFVWGLRQPWCTAERPRTAVSTTLGIVGPAGALLLERWPSLLLLKWEVALRLRKLLLPCCDGRYILPCGRIIRSPWASPVLAGQYPPALYVRWKGHDRCLKVFLMSALVDFVRITRRYSL